MADLQRTGGAPRRGSVQFRMRRRPAVATGVPPLPAAGGRKKKKMAVARLGGGARRGIVAAVRRLRVRWLAYRRALRLLRAFCARALEDILNGAAAAGTVRVQAGADSSFAIGGFAPVVTVGGRC